MIDTEQIARINTLLAESGQTLQRLLAFLHVDSLDQIPASEFLRVEQLLERSKRRVAYLNSVDILVSCDEQFQRKAFETLWAKRGKSLFTTSEFVSYIESF